MTLLEEVQKDYPMINKAAAEFISKLPGNDIKQAIMLAAEMAGLQLLRASKVDLVKIAPGTIVLGAIPDDINQQLERFVALVALSNGIDRIDLGWVDFHGKDKDYHPEITRLESSFHEICQKSSVKVEYYPFVAALTALKLVLAGKKLGLLDARTGLSMTMFHIIAGSKTAPFPAN